jgi:hypothetical protein
MAARHLGDPATPSLHTGGKAWKMSYCEWTTARTQFTVLLGNRFSVTWQVLVKPTPPAVLPFAVPSAGRVPSR